MQIVIDIDESLYNAINQDIYINGMRSGKTILQKLVNAIANGTPIPDDATNGDVVKVMFDTTEEDFYDEDRMVDVYGLDRSDDPSTFYADWWNAPYQKEDKNE